VDSLSLPKINAITTSMQTLHVNRFQTNPFALAKAQHACSHHANNKPSVL
jgi:hypothetical protein